MSMSTPPHAHVQWTAKTCFPLSACVLFLPSEWLIFVIMVIHRDLAFDLVFIDAVTRLNKILTVLLAAPMSLFLRLPLFKR